MEQLLYGAAYYDEYMPYERLQEDIEMMKKAHINVVRIAESTWSTEEPEEGKFDFSHVIKVLEAMQKAGIYVIIGTPTYAIPAWLAKKEPEVMVMDQSGHRKPYGARQIMDITNKSYRFYAERIIRELMKVVQPYSCVIGYQLDNETKHYGTCSENVQALFISYLKKKYNGSIEKVNEAFGLAYWSNSIHSWEDFPSVIGTINGSLGCAFEDFQRSLVTEFIGCQRRIVDEYRRADQFVTHNLDFDWRGHSYGVQPDVNHFDLAKHLTRVGCDIYHPTQDELTGKEIGFCGDLARSLKKDNYYVLETQAQGFPEWTPYEGQLRLQAYSHLASGADAVMYWHWHSIHNGCETYWKGILSHNLKENEVYREVAQIGREWQEIGRHLIHLKKESRVAIMISHESLTAMKWFPFKPWSNEPVSYNDCVRWVYDALFELNVSCDFIAPDEVNLEAYSLIVLPTLYSVSEETLIRINQYVVQGGCIFSTFKTGFSNESVKVWADDQPHVLKECLGITYDQFTCPKRVGLVDASTKEIIPEVQVAHFMELLIPQQANVIAYYDHPQWQRYAAVTKNVYGEGTAYYIGCMTSESYLKTLLEKILKEQHLWGKDQEISNDLVVRKGHNQAGRLITYYLNYSGMDKVVAVENRGVELITGKNIVEKEHIHIKPWDLCIIESE